MLVGHLGALGIRRQYSCILYPGLEHGAINLIARSPRHFMPIVKEPIGVTSDGCFSLLLFFGSRLALLYFFMIACLARPIDHREHLNEELRRRRQGLPQGNWRPL